VVVVVTGMDILRAVATEDRRPTEGDTEDHHQEEEVLVALVLVLPVALAHLVVILVADLHAKTRLGRDLLPGLRQEVNRQRNRQLAGLGRLLNRGLCVHKIM